MYILFSNKYDNIAYKQNILLRKMHNWIHFRCAPKVQYAHIFSTWALLGETGPCQALPCLFDIKAVFMLLTTRLTDGSLTLICTKRVYTTSKDIGGVFCDCVLHKHMKTLYRMNTNRNRSRVILIHLRNGLECPLTRSFYQYFPQHKHFLQHLEFIS